MLVPIKEELLVKIAETIGGEDARKIVEALREMGSATDDQLSLKTGVRLNLVRKILYRLYSHSLVTYDRSRDGKTGWYIFHWRLQPEQVEGFIQTQKRRFLEKLCTRLEFEKSHSFYYCPFCSVRITFEEAMEIMFRCPKCGRSLGFFDNQPIIEFLERKIEELREELGMKQ